jgi:hypothetical protein
MPNNVFIGNKEFFPNVDKILFEGPNSDNPFAFKAYDANKWLAVNRCEITLDSLYVTGTAFVPTDQILSDLQLELSPGTRNKTLWAQRKTRWMPPLSYLLS